jgi:hypothetical protein
MKKFKAFCMTLTFLKFRCLVQSPSQSCSPDAVGRIRSIMWCPPTCQVIFGFTS